MSLNHSALEGAGFTLADQKDLNAGGRSGRATVHHYVLNRNDVGLRPVAHHVFVREYDRNPGKYDVDYEVTQGNHQYSDYDRSFWHRDNVPIASGGSEDPIRDVINYHRSLSRDFDYSPDRSTLSPVTKDNVHTLLPGTHNWVQYGDTHVLRPGPGEPFTTMSAVTPLDIEVARRLKNIGFVWAGRFPGDDGTDLYHKTYPWPDSPDTFNVNFTVRHRPSQEVPFSYSARRVQSGVYDDGTEDSGSSLDVTGNADPVANLDTVHKLVRRHNDMKRALGINVEKNSAFMSHCPQCGSTDVDWTHLWDKDENGLHSIPTNKVRGQCNSCYSEFEPHESVATFPEDDDPLLEAYQRPSHYGSLNKKADEFDNIISGAGHAGPCWACGRATYNYPEGTPFRDDKSYPMDAHEETGGEMHGPSINLCGPCSADEGAYHAARTHGTKNPGRLWHYNDEDVPGCPQCADFSDGIEDWEHGDDASDQRFSSRAAHLMDQADGDLRP